MIEPGERTIVADFERPSQDLVDRFGRLYTGLVLDYMGKHGAMSHRIGPIQPGLRFYGPASTSLGPDLTVRRAAIDLARPGDVLIVAAGGIVDYACFGDGTARRMMTKNLAGAVIDGSVRDAAGIRALGFPTFSIGVTPRNYHYPVAGDHGAVNVPVVCGGVRVRPGDLVMGDDDGVIVLPQENAEQVVAAAERHLREETVERNSWTDYPPFGAVEMLTERGYSVVRANVGRAAEAE